LGGAASAIHSPGIELFPGGPAIAAAYQDVWFTDGEERRLVRVFPGQKGTFGFECGEERGEFTISGRTLFSMASS
jgi:hypothetical protein